MSSSLAEVAFRSGGAEFPPRVTGDGHWSNFLDCRSLGEIEATRALLPNNSRAIEKPGAILRLGDRRCLYHRDRGHRGGDHRGGRCRLVRPASRRPAKAPAPLARQGGDGRRRAALVFPGFHSSSARLALSFRRRFSIGEVRGDRVEVVSPPVRETPCRERCPVEPDRSFIRTFRRGHRLAALRTGVSLQVTEATY